MSFENPDAISISGRGMRFGIVAARFNSELVDGLLSDTVLRLTESGVAEEDMEIIRVPGSYEIPYAISMLAQSLDFDCLIALGVVVRGETAHHDIILQSTATILHKISIDEEVPVINGIIAANTREQAEYRTTGEHNRGTEFGSAALEMGYIGRRLSDRLENLDDLIFDNEFEDADDEDLHDLFPEDDDNNN